MIKGTAYKFGHNVDTDQIIPAKYLITTDPKELAKHCMEIADADFPTKAKPGDIMVAGRNFGCGSSREHAPLSIKGMDLGLVIAESFARIFFRNCINIGMPILECPAAAQEINPGDQLEVDLDTGTIKNVTQNKSYTAQAFPDFMQNIINAGGLMPYVKQRAAAAK
jgi:3-isopropylmalate/(R)-2-methylmalate dehydratase small subunit